jgi:hypothetical protein
MHPGPKEDKHFDQAVFVRYTCPQAGRYFVHATWTALDNGKPGCEIGHAAKGSNSWSGQTYSLNGKGDSVTVDPSFDCDEGDMIFLGVTRGLDDNYQGDSTGVILQIVHPS